MGLTALHHSDLQVQTQIGLLCEFQIYVFCLAAKYSLDMLSNNLQLLKHKYNLVNIHHMLTSYFHLIVTYRRGCKVG